MPELLIELFSEEIPARMQQKAADDLRQMVTNALVEQGLTYEGAQAHGGARRIVLSVEGLDAKAADVNEERKGPRVDAPQAAIEGFGEADHALQSEVGSAAEELGDIGLADAELAGEVGLANSPAGHDLKRLLGEVHAGRLDLVVESVAGTGEDAVNTGELLSGFAHSVSICLDFLAAR